MIATAANTLANRLMQRCETLHAQLTGHVPAGVLRQVHAHAHQLAQVIHGGGELSIFLDDVVIDLDLIEAAFAAQLLNTTWERTASLRIFQELDMFVESIAQFVVAVKNDHRLSTGRLTVISAQLETCQQALLVAKHSADQLAVSILQTLRLDVLCCDAALHFFEEGALSHG